MFLSLIQLTPHAPRSAAFWREISTPYGAHQALWRLFSRSPEQKRDFLFRQDDRGPQGTDRIRFYVLSKERPLQDDQGLWDIGEPKPFAPRLKKGDTLRFMLRASPTVKRRDEETGKSKRDDVVISAKKKLGDAPFDRLAAIHREGVTWLSRVGAKAGFELPVMASPTIGDDGLLADEERPAVQIDGYRQHQIRRRGDAAVRYSTLDFEGVLTLTDPELFLPKVILGFGPQKAFGCGLMLLKRV